MQDAFSNSSAPATETLDGFSFAKWVIDKHQKNGDPVKELLKAAKWHETDWLEKKAAVYPSAEHDPDYRTMLKETLPEALEHQKELYCNEIHKEIVAAVIALRHSRGGVVLIGVDDDNHPVPLGEIQNENSPSLSGNEIDSFGRKQILEKILSRPKFQFIGHDKDWKKIWTETWTFSPPVGSEDVTIRELTFKGNPVLALLVPPLPLESKEFLVAEVSKKDNKGNEGEIAKEGLDAEASKKKDSSNQKGQKVLLRRMSGDAVGQTKRKTIEDDWIENEAQLGEFIRQRKQLFFDNGDLARLRYELSRVIPFAVNDPLSNHRPFIGRDTELAELHRLLLNGKIPVITGPGGTGKTELVLQYAARHKADYPGGLFQIDMEQAKNWDDAFRKLLGTTLEDMYCLLGFSKSGRDRDNERQEPSPKEIAGAIARRAKEKGVILLVLDNVESIRTFFWGASFSNLSLPDTVAIVATARPPSPDDDVRVRPSDRAVEMKLDVLKLDAALKLLTGDHPAQPGAERNAAKSIANMLECRPLFLQSVPALLDRGFSKDGKGKVDTWVSLERRLQEELAETTDEGMQYFGEGGRTPSVLWALTREKLSTHPMGFAWIKLAHVASFFSADGFRKHILRFLWGALIAPEVDTDKAFAEALSILKRHLSFSVSEAECHMHRLTAETLRRSARKDDPNIEEEIGRSLANAPEVTTDDWFSLTGSGPAFAWFPQQLREKVEPNQWLYHLCGAIMLQEEFGWMGVNYDENNRERPQLSSDWPWCYFSSDHWITLLRKEPRFAPYCPWEKFECKDLRAILFDQPQLSRQLKWSSLDVVRLGRLLQPEYILKRGRRFVADAPWFRDIPWSDLNLRTLASLLLEEPLFCISLQWGKLQTQTLFAELKARANSTGKRIPGSAWSCLLRTDSTFDNCCQWDSLDARDWTDLLLEQPQFSEEFSKRREWRELGTLGWKELLARQPRFADDCPRVIQDRIQLHGGTCFLEQNPSGSLMAVYGEDEKIDLGFVPSFKFWIDFEYNLRKAFDFPNSTEVSPDLIGPNDAIFLYHSTPDSINAIIDEDHLENRFFFYANDDYICRLYRLFFWKPWTPSFR